MSILHHPPLLLASKSLRRSELLRAAGIEFSLIDVEVEEDFSSDMDVAEVPEYLARKKAEAAVIIMPPDHLILAADSVVIMNDTIYNKASDREEAINMIGQIAGKEHLVITGVFLCDHHNAIGFSEHTLVWIEPMSRQEIEYYVDLQKPFDKAGAYGIQDWIGWAKISRIEGSYSNVMGLPVHRVYEELMQWRKV
ncbi:MAG: Maf family protein [Bacteroidota bacterium]|nr:Maf family protein [Bacteroidota bacterium]